MTYQTFALKYRPRNFDEIVAQDHVARTLRNAVAEGRVAHGYLFAGPRGTGKTSTARVLAKALNCVEGPTPDPCCVCHMCVAIAQSRALDVIERDAASERGIDRMRELLDKVPFGPAEGRCKVYILDEAHMLTPEASNALLKTLEEPPPHSYFVLATTEPYKILPTIKSRCQSFEFRPIPLRLMVDSLQAILDHEGVKADEAALAAIARAANGAMRDAQSILDQVIAYSPGEITLEVANAVLGVTEIEMLRRIAGAIAGGDIEGCFAAVDEVVSSGKDIGQLIEDLALYSRDLLRLSLGAAPPSWSQTPDSAREGMAEQAQRLGPKTLTRMIKRLSETTEELRASSQHALLLELTLAELAALAVLPVAQPAANPPAHSPAPAAPPPEAPAAAKADSHTPAPAAVEPVPADQELTLELARERWGAVEQALRDAGHVSVVAIVRGARPTALDGERLTLSFPADRDVQRSMVEDRYRGVLADAIERALGRRLALAMALEEGEASPPAAAPRGPSAQPPPVPVGPAEAPATVPSAEQQERIVQEALEVFPGSTEVTDE